jgi:hypothetical protein
MAGGAGPAAAGDHRRLPRCRGRQHRDHCHPDRAREFALLRLVGATRRQVLAVMRWETLIVVAAGALLGRLAMAVPTRMALRPRPVEGVGTRE